MLIPRAPLAVLLALVPLGLRPQEPPAPAGFLCPPCGAECHFTNYAKPGKCGTCGMTLVPLASVPQVGVLLFPRAALSNALLTLSVFAGGDVARAFCVSDTTEPLRLSDSLEVRPQFSYEDAPALDVLVIPDGFGAWEDPLLVEWVQKACARARFVLAVNGGSIVLARAGFLAKERVPVRGFIVERAKELAPELVFDGSVSWRRAGKFFLARDTEGALAATLAIVHELGGEDSARQAAEEFGLAWPAEKAKEGAVPR